MEEKFDINKLNELRNQHRYQEAADYYRNFDFTKDPEAFQQVNREIEELEALDRKEKALYTRYQDVRPLNAIKFVENVYSPNAIAEMIDAKDDLGHNIYNSLSEFENTNPHAARYLKLWKDLGSEENIASGLSISIPTSKKGWLGGDWTVEDINDDAVIFDYIKQKFGITRDEILKEGKITLDTSDPSNIKYNIDKDSNYAAQFLYGLAKTELGYTNRYNMMDIRGYDADNNMLPIKYDFAYNSIIDESDFGTTGHKEYQYSILKNLVNLIDDAESIKAVANNDLKKEMREVNGTSWNISLLAKQANKNHVLDLLKSGNLSLYSPYYAEEYGALTKDYDADTYNKFIERLAAADSKDVSITGYTANGITGIMITQQMWKDKNHTVKGKVEQLFVPDLFPELTKTDLYNHTDILAQQEYNNMIDYGAGYKYKFLDSNEETWIDEGGNVRRSDAKGMQYVDNSPSARANLIRDINKDIILRHAISNIPLLANNKKEIESDKLDAYAQSIALGSQAELYPNERLYDVEGKEVDYNKLFEQRKENVENDFENYNPMMAFRIKSIYDLYDSILNNVIKRGYRKK